MISRETQVRLVFVALGVLAWLGARELTDNDLVLWTILLGIGVVVPTMIAERMRAADDQTADDSNGSTD